MTLQDFNSFAPPPKQMVFIDARLQESAAILLKDVAPTAEVHFIDAGKDGIDQMDTIIKSSQTAVSSIKILSSASAGDGSVQLGDSLISEQSVQERYGSELSTWGSHLTYDANVSIYSCNPTDTTGAKSLVDTLSQALGTAMIADSSIALDAPVLKELVFVDSSLANHQDILKGIAPDAKIYMIDAGSDGLTQIDQVIKAQGADIGSIQILSASDGKNIELGNKQLNSDTLNSQYADMIAGWKTHLTADGKISLYVSEKTVDGMSELLNVRLSDVTGEAVNDGMTHEVVFVDSAVQDYLNLIDNMKPGVHVVMLDGTKDGIDQISDYLLGQTNLDAIHLISHGSGGTLILCGQAYTTDRLAQYTMDFARIGQSLKVNGDILLYGCDIAKGSAGAQFISKVADMTGADVAASIDKTGIVDLGGNWILEANTGTIDASSVITTLHNNYDFLLTAPPIDISGVTLDFNGANRTLVSGVDKTAGAVYKYSNVATIAGTQIDAYVTITGITNATLVTVDNDAPGTYVAPPNTTVANVFAPEIDTTAANINGGRRE